jgi:hypothetical protein
MNPYFFDVVTDSGVQHDFQGRKLERLDDAREWARVIALDLECSDDDRSWGATEIEVRDVDGTCLYSVSVRHIEIMVD